ncbi:hypothetical protein BpHYR1_014533 [Brachionus plicatilis]|uniref:Uncharacterized protein n=1 Tax=Brachionus plicatilis TaxID=10195 RepID=A0A3M7PZ09_BRAPC|nr:hypothetical protein BpHYR1_014533 [Brachionus plicatilis]
MVSECSVYCLLWYTEASHCRLMFNIVNELTLLISTIFSSRAILLAVPTGALKKISNGYISIKQSNSFCIRFCYCLANAQTWAKSFAVPCCY